MDDELDFYATFGYLSEQSFLRAWYSHHGNVIDMTSDHLGWGILEVNEKMIVTMPDGKRYSITRIKGDE